MVFSLKILKILQTHNIFNKYIFTTTNKKLKGFLIKSYN